MGLLSKQETTTESSLPVAIMSSYSFSSSSYSSNSNTRNGETTSHSHSAEKHSDPRGTTVRTTTQNNGGPAVEDTRYFDASGREVPADRLREGRTLEGAGASSDTRGRIEDVGGESETDRLYRERIEEEYAKREGGA